MSRVGNMVGSFIVEDFSTGAVSLWCMRAVGQRNDGSTIICARRKSRADDKACRVCGGGS